MKGVSPIIATIMLLLITIAMVGLAYGWFNTIWQSITASTQNATEHELRIQNQKIDIVSPKNGSINVMNIGRYNIDGVELHVYINGVLKNVGVPGSPGTDCNWDATSVTPSGSIKANCNCTAGQNIKIIAPGNSDIGTCFY